MQMKCIYIKISFVLYNIFNLCNLKHSLIEEKELFCIFIISYGEILWKLKLLSENEISELKDIHKGEISTYKIVYTIYYN